MWHLQPTHIPGKLCRLCRLQGPWGTWLSSEVVASKADGLVLTWWSVLRHLKDLERQCKQWNRTRSPCEQLFVIFHRTGRKREKVLSDESRKLSLTKLFWPHLKACWGFTWTSQSSCCLGVTLVWQWYLYLYHLINIARQLVVDENCFLLQKWASHSGYSDRAETRKIFLDWSLQYRRMREFQVDQWWNSSLHTLEHSNAR